MNDPRGMASHRYTWAKIVYVYEVRVGSLKKDLVWYHRDGAHETTKLSSSLLDLREPCKA